VTGRGISTSHPSQVAKVFHKIDRWLTIKEKGISYTITDNDMKKILIPDIQNNKRKIIS
jgi:hypothetical protein